MEFLDRRVIARSAVEVRKTPVKTDRYARSHSISTSPIRSEPCSVCEKSHSTYTCIKFKNMGLSAREQLVRYKRLCTICLGKHRVEECKSNFKCTKEGCQQRHSSFLHKEVTVRANACRVPGNRNGLLPTARVTLVSGDLRFTVKCLLDQGSMRSFVSERVVQALQLPRHRSAIMAAGIGGASQKVKGEAQIAVPSVLKTGKKFILNVLIFRTLIGQCVRFE